MNFLSLFLIGVGLSADAFAVAICKGLAMPRIQWRQALAIALAFGFFQALMPLIGWALGTSIAWIIEPIDHWIAFILLLFVGGKMLIGALREDEQVSDTSQPKLDLRELLMLAVATSIDALAVGISFALLEVNIWFAILVIGCTTFVLSAIGVLVGHFFGARFSKPATIVGGVVLILIGVKILLEDLGIISF